LVSNLSSKPRYRLVFFVLSSRPCSWLRYFFANYYNPPSPFWDENYHVAASQKYQEGVFFLELHPPLGKLLITAGESLFSPNDLSDEEIQETVTTDYLNPFPEGFSFVGVRFFPALLAFLGSYVFFLSLYLILKILMQPLDSPLSIYSTMPLSSILELRCSMVFNCSLS
jgi:dolichyl-phosphate-mannose--protein O-mannosyl transferase